MKLKFKILLSLLACLPLLMKAQNHDHVFDPIDSLTKLYYFQKIEFEPNNTDFKPGEIPQYSEQVYQARIKELNQNSPFNFVYNAQVRKYIDGYIKNPSCAGTILTNSRFYFPMIEKHFVHNKIPLELKFLSVVESGMNPVARSHCGAAGLWQFMYGTGKSYQLKIDSYVDERYDPERETIAACHYLKDLYAIYKDWALVIAAYNCGPGTINKAIKLSGGKKDFWAISAFLPRESQGYVPAFIAATYALTYYKEHNLRYAKPEFIPNYMDFIIVNKKTTLKALAKKTGMSYESIKYLNPKFYTEVIPGNNDFINVPHDVALAMIGSEKENNTALANNTSSSTAKTKKSKGKGKSKAKESVKLFVDSIVTTDPNLNYVEVTDHALTLYAEAQGEQQLTDSSIVLFHTTHDFQLNGQTIPANSIMQGKSYFLPNSIYLKIDHISFGNEKLFLHFESEILEQPIDGKFTINDDYLEIFKL